MERPEAQDVGSIILTGFNPEVIIQSVKLVIGEHKMRQINPLANDYSITDTSWRVLKLVMGNTGLSNKWWGIEK